MWSLTTCDKIEHFERAGELEPDNHVGSRAPVARRSGGCGAWSPEASRRGHRRRSVAKAADVRSSHMPPSTAVTIVPARRVHGRLQVPGDKSISHRYALLAALAEGRSELTNFAPGADCRSTLACLERLGIDVAVGVRRLRYFNGTRGRTSQFTGRAAGRGQFGDDDAADGRRSGGTSVFQPVCRRRARFPAGRCVASSSRSSTWARASRPPTATPPSRCTARACRPSPTSPTCPAHR